MFYDIGSNCYISQISMKLPLVNPYLNSNKSYSANTQGATLVFVNVCVCTYVYLRMAEYLPGQTTDGLTQQANTRLSDVLL